MSTQFASSPFIQIRNRKCSGAVMLGEVKRNSSLRTPDITRNPPSAVRRLAHPVRERLLNYRCQDLHFPHQMGWIERRQGVAIGKP